MLVAPWLLSGCGGGSAVTTNVGNTENIRVMSQIYGVYLSSHQGKPPQDEQEFRDFLATKQDLLTQAGLTVDAMFVSPRNGEPLQWVYGKPLRSSPTGMTFIGYEKSSADGQRLAVATRGMYELLDEAKFHAQVPAAN
jgi:hypothetical protein